MLFCFVYLFVVVGCFFSAFVFVHANDCQACFVLVRHAGSVCVGVQIGGGVSYPPMYFVRLHGCLILLRPFHLLRFG